MLNAPHLHILESPDWQEYALLDSGNGQKLEQYGQFRLVRPEAEAVWEPGLPPREWDLADAIFHPAPEENGGHWEPNRRTMPDRWKMQYRSLKFWAAATSSRHLGVFPEQAAQWDWIESQVKSAAQPSRVLNLFGYTGIASLAAAHAGAQVTHLDASRKSITWAKENQQLTGLPETSIRWMLDDALKFVQREARRGSCYEGIILDPPKFGRGPKGEVWEFYKLLPNLLSACREILSPNPQFVILTAYAVKASALTLHYALSDMITDRKGTLEAGEVVLTEKSRRRLLSMAIYARWSAG